MVENGWAKVRDDRKDDNETALTYLQKLRDLESQAKADSKGLWAKSDPIQSSPAADAPALVSKYKGKSLDAVVEKVLTGDRLIVRLKLSPTEHVQTMLVIAGVRTPATKRTSPEGKDVPAEPYGTEAHQFVETRMHQRSCKVTLVGVTPQGQLIGTVLHPRGNIAKFLLDEGLARSHDQHVTLLGNDMAPLRQAETTAKNSRKGLFATVSASKTAGPQDADYTVVRILNAETIFIRPRSGDEKKVNLSSIRQPKPSDPKQAPFGAEAKEFLRKRLIGKHVKVSIDGKKPATEGFEEREVATVISNGKNMALAMVEAGYASVIRHRRDDDDRSPEYDALILAEEAAQKEEKGMWSEKPSAAKQYQDYSENLQKAKMEASVLQRQRKVPAVVDFVRGGSRFVVLIPRENAKLTFILSGIQVPKPARNADDKAEPFGQEAYDFANRRCLQRDVELDVEDTDKVGGFIGTMHVGRENFAKALLEEGLAEVHAYSAEKTGNAQELMAAQQKAKEARKGMWHDWDPSKDVEEEPTAPTNGTAATNGQSSEPTPRRKDYRDVMVTDVDETGKLKVQLVGSGTTQLTELMSAFRSFHVNKANSQPLKGPPKVGDIVAAQFTVDNDWYRAKVRRVDREAEKVDLTYLDYGNSETVPWSRLRPLSQPQFSTQKLKPQAVDATLSLIQMPTNAQYLRDCVGFVMEQTEGREMVANVDSTGNDGTLSITLLYPKADSLDVSLNSEIIREGLAMVPRKLKGWERGAEDSLKHLRELEEEAKKERRGMWEYGDLTED